MIYDLLDAKRLYRTYLQNLNLIKVSVYGQEEVPAITPVPPPTPGQSLGTAGAGAVAEGGSATMLSADRAPPPPVDMRYYNDLMNTIPQESVSVPLIMHCMLEQVSLWYTDEVLQ
ncbi:sperm-associated antigen 17 [Plakobranchus ocellatus]|uniref:Sperm-associated antigen 17 n=1 Tax=Plakobranchus ocellatus TaxID=259542 RepID=A0AAV4CXM1_9GAST|nr:sperm-associated antigen 17 [Plakobranchus ocellatus]